MFFSVENKNDLCKGTLYLIVFKNGAITSWQLVHLTSVPNVTLPVLDRPAYKLLTTPIT